MLVNVVFSFVVELPATAGLVRNMVYSRGGGRARSLYATPRSPPPPPPAPRVLKDSGAGGHGANGAKIFVPCLVEGGIPPPPRA